MHLSSNDSHERDHYLIGPGPAWFAFAMTIALMVFDFVDRQIIVSLFPHMKADWGLSDKELGGLVSIVAITVALGCVPVALFADRVSRVKSVFVMAATWSLACISCMFTRNYAQLFAARAFVGLGEAGYGSVGAAIIAVHFPARMRSTLLAAFLSSASIGSVLGVVLGGFIATHWGWKTAFGIVGIPGLVLALCYLKVRDYSTFQIKTRHGEDTRSPVGVVRYMVQSLVRSRTVAWVCIGDAAQLIVVSSIMAWLPSYLNRMYGTPPDQAGIKAALIVLCGAVGSVIWGVVVDRLGANKPRAKLRIVAGLCIATMVVFLVAFGGARWGIAWSGASQFAVIALGALLMTCTLGPVTAVVFDIIHPGVRSTGAAALALFRNLFGHAAGPFIVGLLSDAWGLQSALAAIPFMGLVAAAALLRAVWHYEGELRDSAALVQTAGAPA
jgi:MFS family permease